MDPTDPSQVLTAACTAIFSYRPGPDATQRDAALRATPLLADRGADWGFAILAPITGTQWRRWAEQAWQVEPEIQVASRGDNPDLPTIISRAITVTLRLKTAAGQPVDETIAPLTVSATAARQRDGTWRLSHIGAL